jgi:alkaline phosphatase
MPYGKKSPKQKRSCYKMKAADYNNSPMMKNFPDLNKDGKVTKADVLMGAGVELNSPKKKYKSDAQRKAIHASKAEQAAMKYMNKRMKSNKPCPGCKSICPSCRK